MQARACSCRDIYRLILVRLGACEKKLCSLCRSFEHFDPAGVGCRGRNVSHLTVFDQGMCERACPLGLLPSKYHPSFTTLENYPFAVPIEPRPSLPKTGRAPMMISATHKSS